MPSGRWYAGPRAVTTTRPARSVRRSGATLACSLCRLREEFDKLGFVLKRVPGKQRTPIKKKYIDMVARVEHESWREERKRQEPNREDLEHWKQASADQQNRTRGSVRFLHEVLFMIGLDLVKRSEHPFGEATPSSTS